MRVALITAIYGDVDDLKEFKPQVPSVDQFCFTDRPLRSDSWRVISRPYHAESEFGHHPAMAGDNMRAKYYKFQSHRIDLLQGYDFIVWIDGSIYIKRTDFVSQIVSYADSGFCFFAHPSRDCAYREAAFCTRVPKYRGMPLMSQCEAYRAAGFPEHYGLPALTMFAIRQDGAAQRILDECWSEVLAWGLMDQVSIPYVFWRNNFKPDIFPHHLVFNGYTQKRNHSAAYGYLGKI